jgi:YesN/AraC family two-component response regulator
VETAFDGEDAFEKIQANSFDVLVTENQMPRLSGVKLVDQIREFNSPIMVVMISAVPIRLDRKTKNRLRLNGILSKPFKAKELLDCLENIGREIK